MAAFDPATLDRWRTLAIVDRDGATVGTISEFYLDRETGHPTWALVSTGLFGASQAFVPLVHATELGDGLQVPYEKRHIKDAPQVDPHDELTPDEEAALFTHYGVDYRPSTEPAVEDSLAAGPGGPEPTEPTAAVTTEAGSAGSAGAVAPEAGSAGSAGSVPAEPEPVGPAGGVPGDDRPLGGVAAEPGPVDPAGGAPGPDGPTGAVPTEPGTSEPRDQSGADAGQAEPAAERRSEEPPGLDPDLSRPAPVEPGLPGSFAVTPSGPTPTTIEVAGPAEASRDVEGRDGSPPPDPQADRWPSAPDDRTAGDPGRPSEGPGPVPATDEAARTAGWSPGAFGGPEPADRPAGTGDRWREAKLAAERDRIARAAAAQPEERSPLGRARRRLERLVSGGQEPADPAVDSPTDRDAAERARRERLGLDDDPRR